ncbi:MAG: hypothetical protein FWD31_04755 [Planctomycetaceae bacterium]|nr:hypothetical protein [Planctomycetaceae bacterium]
MKSGLAFARNEPASFYRQWSFPEAPSVDPCCALAAKLLPSGQLWAA